MIAEKSCIHYYKTLWGKWMVASMCLMAAILAGCSDDIGYKAEMPDGGGDLLTINLSIPAIKVIDTRAGEDEYTLEEAMLFIFDSEKNFLRAETMSASQITDISTQSATKKRMGCVLDMSTKDGMAYIYVVGNANSLPVGGGKTLSDFEGSMPELESIVAETPSTGIFLPLIMSGKQIVSANMNEVEITLNRLAAKITVAAESTLQGYTLKSFSLYNAGTGTYLRDPADVNYAIYEEGEGNPVILASENTGLSNPLFSYPAYGALTAGHADDGAYVIVKVENNSTGNQSYFRLNLRKRTTSGTSTQYTPLDINSNNWYKIQIEEILKDGYARETDAAAHPEDDGENIRYQIHDHSANVFSMVTDGIRELGVTADVDWYDWDGETGDNPNIFTVRCYSPIAGEEDTLPSFEILEGDDWLDLVKDNSGAPVYSEDEEISGSGGETDHDGIVRKFGLLKRAEGSYAVIRVSWKNLSREVIVNRTPKSDYSAECDIVLNIYKMDNGVKTLYSTISDYWTFIKGEGTLSAENSSGSNTPRLFGVDEEAMGKGKTREGLHFPVMYGDDAENPWVYEYTITSRRTNVTGVIPHISASQTDAVISNNLKAEGNAWGQMITEGDKSVKLTFDSRTAGYTYGLGQIYIVVERDNDDVADWIYLPVYHTGFFHFDNASPVEEDKGYYYYEVVPMGDSHWLDRNIGAKSCRMYVDNITNSQGNGDAKGRFYSIASQGTFTDPTMNDSRICPPGFHIPTTQEWDKMRLTTNFRTSATEDFDDTVISTYYATGNSRVGNVYFPKARLYNLSGSNNSGYDFVDGPNTGLAGSGYYWTRSTAPAMEKDELGNWLRVVYLQGASSSFNNGSVSDHKMPVRCVAGKDAPPVVQNPISFNVHGATHVYLVDRNSGNPLYTFPGKSVGTVESVTSSWFNFYCTTNLSESDILLLFVRLENNGSITLFTKEGDNFTSDKNLDEIEINKNTAWEVKRGWYYDFCDNAKERGTANVTETMKDNPDTPKSFRNGDRITFHWLDRYETVSHPKISIADKDWVNSLIGGWSVDADDEGDGMKKITINSLGEETTIINLNVEDAKGGSKIRYDINYTPTGITIEYKYSTGDQVVKDNSSLKKCYVESHGYNETFYRYEYDIYLYTEDSPATPSSFLSGDKITFHWQDVYEGCSHPKISAGDADWNNILNGWSQEADDEGDGMKKITINSLRKETSEINLNVEDADGGNKIRYYINYTSSGINVSYNPEENDQKIYDDSNLDKAYVVERGYNNRGFEYDIYLYEEEAPEYSKIPRFYNNSSVTFKWLNNYSDKNHPDIYGWEGNKHPFGDWPGKYAGDNRDGNDPNWLYYTLPPLSATYDGFSILVFDNNDNGGNGSKMRFEITSNNGLFTVRINQEAEDQAQSFNFTVPDGYVNSSFFDGKWHFDVVMTHP